MYRPNIHDPRLEKWIDNQTHAIRKELVITWIKSGRRGLFPTDYQARQILIDRIAKRKIVYEEDNDKIYPTIS